MMHDPRNKGRQNRGGLLIFSLVIAALLAIVVVGVELARRANTTTNVTAVPGDASASSYPREVTDALGEKFVIPAKPKRVVSQTLGTDEILLNICSPEQIIALSSLAEDENSSNVADRARAIPGRVTIGAEQILQLQPDLIFVASYSRAETVQQLKASKAPVFRFANFSSLEDIKGNIRTVGYAAGCDAAAENLVRRMSDELAQIRARVPRDRKPIRAMSFGGGFTAGRNTIFDDMLRAAGAVNVSAENNIDGFAKISPEKIAEWEPDFIVAGASYDVMESKKKELLADPIIAATDAGKNGRVIILDNRHYLTVSHYVVRGVEELAAGLYGSSDVK